MQITPKSFTLRAAKNSPRFLPALMRISTENMFKMPALNFLEPHARFHYPHCLVSYAERSPKPNSINNRTCAYVLGDSGGYSLSKGRAGWVFDWHDRKLADAACRNILNWYDATADEGITLDVPLTTPIIGKQPYIQNWQDCLNVSVDNVRFMSNASPATPLLNVIQVSKEQHVTDTWYNTVKQYQLQGWSIAGFRQGALPVALFIDILLRLHHDGLLRKPSNRVHIFGVGTARWMFILNAIQQHFPDVRFTCDNSNASLVSGRWGDGYPTPTFANDNIKATPFPGKKELHAQLTAAGIKQPYQLSFEAMHTQGLVADFTGSPVLTGKMPSDFVQGGKLTQDGYEFLRTHNTWAQIHHMYGLAYMHHSDCSHYWWLYEQAVDAVFTALKPFHQLRKETVLWVN